MILQYSSDDTECYQDAQSICFLTVPLRKESDIVDVIETTEKKTEKVWGKPVFEIREEKIISSNSKIAKIAILSDKDRSKSRALIFRESTILYLLNDNGKTLKMF